MRIQIEYRYAGPPPVLCLSVRVVTFPTEYYLDRPPLCDMKSYYCDVLCTARPLVRC